MLLVSPDDPRAMGRAVAELMAAPEKCHRLGEGVRMLLQSLTWERLLASAGES